MKRIVIILISVLLALSVLPAFAQEEDWKTAYTTVSLMDGEKLYLADIDFDGTPELWLLRDGAFSVFTSRSGQAVPLSVQPMSYRMTDARITLREKKGGFVWRVDAALENGGTFIARFRYEKNAVRFSDSFRVTDGKYFCNAKKVAKSSYDKKLNAFEKTYPQAEYVVSSGTSLAVVSAACEPLPPVYPVKITLKKKSLTLGKGAEAALVCAFTPADCTVRHLTFATSDESVACVDETGVITALKAGTAVVTVTTDNGVSAKCAVTVTGPKPTGVTIVSENEETSIFGKQTLQLTASVLPEDAAQNVTWSSSKKGIATVSKTGLVKGVKAGTATITAKTKNGKKASIKITVRKPVSVTGVDIPEKYIELAGGATRDLFCTILPEDATNRALLWYSDDENIATVDANGLVTGVSVGETVITAMSANGFSSACNVRVHAGEGVTRRAFLLGTGNNDYITSLDIDDPEQKANEVWQISQMLQQQTFPTEIEITSMVNPNRASTALTAIRNAFSPSDEDDVNYLYLVCHGSNPDAGAYELAIGSNGSITGAELREALESAKGTFYIFIEACYSGELIGKGASFDTQAFVDSFGGTLASKRGELADDRFHVYCSGTSREESTYFWVDKNRNMSIFGYALSMAGGWEPALYEETSRSVSLAADTNGDNCVTDKELTAYLTAKIRNMSKKKQTLCVWPKVSDNSILFRKETN